MRRLALGLVHHPVLDRQGELSTTAITNLDLHDMARSAKTYGAEALYVVHPLEAQCELARRIRDHWIEGRGKKRIPTRAVALELLRIVPTLERAYDELGGGRGGVELWTTAAQARGSITSFAEARARLAEEGPPVLLLFGTGWGLTPQLLDEADLRTEPIRGVSPSGYNHLSVRSACAIALDRLRG